VVDQRWAIVLLVVVGLILGLAIAGFPSRSSGPASVPLVTGDGTPTTGVSDSSFATIAPAPPATLPPRGNLPNSILSGTTTTTR
jgi:hypothetical protein